MLAPLTTLLLGISTAVAQNQERKLIDRLLKPNTALANPAQDKKFVVSGDTSFDKRIPPQSFYSRQKPLAKTFPGERSFAPKQFAALHFRMSYSPPNLARRAELTKNDKLIRTPPAPGIRAAPESDTVSPARDFTGNRPFLGRGKSQRALQAYNRPLTIEQVRELLNKSK